MRFIISVAEMDGRGTHSSLFLIEHTFSVSLLSTTTMKLETIESKKILYQPTVSRRVLKSVEPPLNTEDMTSVSPLVVTALVPPDLLSYR